jgi:hypothetical protein
MVKIARQAHIGRQYLAENPFYHFKEHANIIYIQLHVSMYIREIHSTAHGWIVLEIARSSERFSLILARALFLHIGRRADE